MVIFAPNRKSLDHSSKHIPTYSLNSFSTPESADMLFKVEVFDARRHFEVQYPHRHDFFEVLYLAKGSGYHVIDNNKYQIKPPCVFFMSPGQAHKLELSQDIEGFIFLFTEEFYRINQTNINRLLEFPFFFTLQRNNPPLLLKSQSDIAFLETLFKRGISEADKKGRASLEQIRAILNLLLITSSNLYPSDDMLASSGKGHILVKRFYQLVEENFQKNWHIKQYADQLAITPNHLTQTVRRLTGKTSNEIITSKQVLEIKRLLVHTNMGVTEIANHMNFVDQSYFTKFFKKSTGTTPLKYRAAGTK